MPRKRILLMLISLSGLLFTGYEDECGLHAGNWNTPGTAIAGTAGGQSTVGVTVTRPVPSAVESLRDVQANAPKRQNPSLRNRAIPFRRILKTGNPAVFAPQLYLNLSPAVSSLYAPASMAPALSNSFTGLPNPTSPDIVPPDTMGAAGPNHFVSILNSDFGVFSKTGTRLSKVSLRSFWSSLGSPANSPFDPRILYDQHSGRFIASSAGGGIAPNSWLLIAVSSSSNPLDNWVKVAIDADIDNGTTQTGNGADFPGLGVDNTNIYIAANMFDSSDFYQYSKVWVIPKSQLLTGQPGNLTWSEFSNPTGSDSSMQPAHTFGTPGAEYFVYEGGLRSIHIARVAFPGGTPTWTDLLSVQVNNYSRVISLPGIPQQGSSNTIDAGDTRVLNAVFRNGSLWTTHHVNNGGKIEVAWYQIDPGSMTVSMQGRISDSSIWYVYPSIAVNQKGDAAVGFTGSSATQYAGAYYTARENTDPAGTMQSVNLLKAGESSYYKILSGVDNRWGDYSATCVDPTDDLTFWTVQEYAASPSNTWGTWIGSFTFTDTSAPAAPDNLAATSASGSQINLSWADRSTNERSFVIERKTGSGSYALLDILAANTTTYSDSGLSENTTYSYRVKAVNGFGDSAYSNEASATTYLAAPAGLSATASSSTQVDLSWTNQSAIATRILIERKTGASGVFSQIDNIAATRTTYPDNTVTTGTTYYYRLKATFLSLSSIYSNEAGPATPGEAQPSSGGGGGGGCAMIPDRRNTEADPSPLGTVLPLLSPLGLLAWRRKTARKGTD